jgi:hypothetical protein
MRTPTADDPVNPILSTTPCSSAERSPSKANRPSHTTVRSTPSGSPPRWNSSVNAAAMAGVYSAGFQTTVLPHSSAGTRYQDGTATGKFPAVMIAATPTGVR